MSWVLWLQVVGLIFAIGFMAAFVVSVGSKGDSK